MSAEPKWPTPAQVLAKMNGQVDDISELAINMCRAAWLAANDDPSKSPVGEVRQRPGGIYVSVRLDYDDGDHTYPWTAIYKNGRAGGDSHDTLKGCSIIGAVPGTPAAEAQS